MQIYNRYIVINLLMPVLVITMTLTGIAWLTQSLRFIDLIVNRGLDVSTFLYVSALQIPFLLLIILPVAFFTSVLFVYNRLMNDSELIVLKSGGLSRLALAKPALMVAVLMVVVGYIVSLYLLPASYREFKDTQAFIRDNYASVLLQEGVFSSPSKNMTVYIEARKPNGMLQGIMVYDSRDTDAPRTYMAQEGRLVATESGPRFEMINGTIQNGSVENNDLVMLDFESYPLDLSVYTQDTRSRQREPEERYLAELFLPEEEVSETFRNRLLAEGHHRIAWPLLNIVMTLVSLSILFTGQFNRRGQWKRILAATLCCVSVVGGYLGLFSLIAKMPALVVVLYMVMAMVTLFCLYILITDRHVFSDLVARVKQKRHQQNQMGCV